MNRIHFKKVKLPRGVDFVYCFSKEKIITEEECDNYEYNLECDKNKDFFHRTHRKGSLAGYNYTYHAGDVLNSCKYCLENNKLYDEFILPIEVTEKKDFPRIEEETIFLKWDLKKWVLGIFKMGDE